MLKLDQSVTHERTTRVTLSPAELEKLIGDAILKQAKISRGIGVNVKVTIDNVREGSLQYSVGYGAKVVITEDYTTETVEPNDAL